MWDGSPESVNVYKGLECKHGDLLKTEETMWRQRCRSMWLKEGVKNSKFFHEKEKQRGKANSIKKLKDDRGVWWHRRDRVERVLIDHFTSLFATSNPSRIEKTCMVVKDRLSSDHVDWCNRIFSMADVKEAIDQMHPLKAPGPDGLPAIFFQKYWHIVGSDVGTLALDILNEGKSLECVNRTFVVLIPKCKNPSSPSQFRPISLCNVIMKIVTKTH